MTVAALIVVPLLILAGVGAAWWVRQSRILPSRFRESVVVTTKDGVSFAGILFAADRSSLVVRKAEAVGAGENRTNLPLDGELILLLADVAYIQRL